MPVIITKDSVEYNLVPAPLVSFSKQVYNNLGRPGFGSDFSASLQGTLIPTHGNPYSSGLSTASWTKTREVEDDEIQTLNGTQYLDVTIKKQEQIRNLFSNTSVSGVAKPIKVTIRGWEDDENAGSGLSFYGFVDDISFDADSRWVNPTTYTVNLRNASFLNSANTGLFPEYYNENSSGWMISSLTENFDIQEDGRLTINFNNVVNDRATVKALDKVYTITRSITAIGSPVYDANGEYLDGISPWQQASGFIYEYLMPELTGTFPSGRLLPGSGYNEANAIFQESIDKEAGSYSLNKTSTFYSGQYPVIESITINQDIGENESNSISVQGTIQGLNTFNGFLSSGNAFLNAEAYWTGVVDTGIPKPYHYARGILPANKSWLHPRPLTKSVGRDFNAGTISYTYNFDDRPPNIVSGSISESIQISDTYPGEIFSVTPVIGRSQPILQYLNSRSEYKRNLSINVIMGQPTGYAWNPVLGGNVNKSGLVTSNQTGILSQLFLSQKPSISNTAELNYIYQAANPVNDPYITIVDGKCFHSSPSESWDARTRNYTYSIEWTYERQ